MGAVMEFMNPLTFASDAALLAVAGLACWVLAGVCLLMDKRREKYRSVDRLERVGFVPWTGLFLGLAIIGGGCLAMSLPVVLGNL
ncbi:hypothetical protein [uncultured Erythrobacter sp.]|uniref:hypothetical protein n=1 Tax=uncultured Erythrobacter sp. TaxID=263913 RepID=UPI00262F836F|nr:hypothetical protein [uncultured Erythrobacter sp.]